MSAAIGDDRGVMDRPLIGRDAPLRELEDALAAPPAVVLLSGEAGIGKTRLVTEIERAAGFVLHGECLEFGGEALPYGPVVAALRGLPPDWLAAQPTDGLAARPAARARAVAGAPAAQLHELCWSLLDRLADARGPVLLVLEDVQWADPSTLALLAFLARNLREQRLVVLATYRVDDELAPAVRRLASELSRRPLVRRIELAPLGPEDVARQLAALSGQRVPATLARELHARAGGNPFFVEELYAAQTDTAHRGRAAADRAARRRHARRDGGRRRAGLARAAGAARRSHRTRCARGSTRACSCACPTGWRSGTA